MSILDASGKKMFDCQICKNHKEAWRRLNPKERKKPYCVNSKTYIMPSKEFPADGIDDEYCYNFEEVEVGSNKTST